MQPRYRGRTLRPVYRPFAGAGTARMPAASGWPGAAVWLRGLAARWTRPVTCRRAGIWPVAGHCWLLVPAGTSGGRGLG